MARHARYDRKTALDKAIDLFWEKGYHGSSMKQIEHALDMRPGSLYATFGSKEGLFQEALATYAEQGQRDLISHLQDFDSIIEGLQDYLRTIACSGQSEAPAPSRACMIVKTLLESRNTQATLAAQANDMLAEIERALTEVLERAKSRGELAAATDCHRLARLYQAQLMGLTSMGERNLDARAMQWLGDDMAAILDSYRTQH